MRWGSANPLSSKQGPGMTLGGATWGSLLLGVEYKVPSSIPFLTL